MTSPRPQRRGEKFHVARYKLALLLTCAAFGLAYLNLYSERRRRSSPIVDPMPSQRTQRRETITYAVGYGFALMLTCAAFGLVYFQLLRAQQAYHTVLGLGLAQMVVHFRCFLHVDLKRSARADLQLVLFSSLIVALMVGGTLVVLFNLHKRMM